MEEIEEIKEFLGHIQPKVGENAFAAIWETVEALEIKLIHEQSLPIDNVRVSTAMECLTDLVQVKEWKETHGKDEHYKKARVIAWRNAKNLIKEYSRHSSV